MPKNISCLLALALAIGSTLIANPSQAETAAKSNRDIIVSTQSSTNTNSTSNLSSPRSVNKNKTTNISQSKPEASSTTASTQTSKRERNWVYSRIGFGLKQ